MPAFAHQCGAWYLSRAMSQPPSSSARDSGGQDPHPYRKAAIPALGSALGAAFMAAAIDALLTLRAAHDLSFGAAVRLDVDTLALYAVPALSLGVVFTAIVGAIHATHGEHAVLALRRRLVEDAALDQTVAATMLAACLAGAAFVPGVASLALRLVGATARKSTGALLLGAGALALLPVLALTCYPLFRATRRLLGWLPRPRRLSVTLALALILLLGAAGGLVLIVATKLDWRVLPTGAFLQAGIFALAFVIGYLLLARMRPPRRARFLTVIGSLAGAALIWATTLPRSDRTLALLADESLGARWLAAGARFLGDRDGDGYAAILGGGDCNDRDPRIHPGAHDEPGDGIDENCLGGDARAEAVAVPPVETASDAAARFRWQGNILLIAIDTLRADRLGTAGYLRRGGRSLTPRIDALARQGIAFRRAYAQAPNTPRSFPSLFVSRLPSEIRWDQPFQNYPVVQPENVTIFEALADAGYDTVGISSHFFFTAERGITQGFREYDNEGALSIKDSNHDVAAPRIVPRVVARLSAQKAAGKPFVLFAHLFEPHSTYMEHPELPVTAHGLEGLEEKYDYEIAFVDRYVGEIVDALDREGLANDTMVVLFSDHGEAFGAHRYGGERMFFHGQTLYDELLHVPLIVRLPGAAPAAVDTPVMLLDLAPTLLAAVKAKVPPAFQGRSLLAALLGERLQPAPVYAELERAPAWDHAAKMLIDEDGKTKVIYRTSDNQFELYDLATDPNELHDLARTRGDLLLHMKRQVATWMERSQWR